MTGLAVAAWCLDAGGPEAIARAAELGFDRVQIDVGRAGEEYDAGRPQVLANYRRLASHHRVRVLGVGAKAVNDLGMVAAPGSTAARACAERVDAAVDAAVTLGASLVFFPAFRASRIRDRQGLEHTAHLLRRACRRARPHDLQVASESVLDVDGQLRLVAAVAEPNFRLVFDSYNPVLAGQRPADLVAPLARLLANQVHLKDGVGGRMGSAALGEGEGGFFDTARALRKAGFRGIAVLENRYHPPHGVERLVADRRTAERALEPSPDPRSVLRGEPA